jgi:hypothetical protein
MATFNTNQATQFYVALTSVDDGITSSNDLGDVYVGSIGEGNNKEIYFQQKGAGGIVRSDLIKVSNIEYVNYKEAADMEKSLKVATITLSADVLTSTALTYGGDYILKLRFTNALSLSPDNQYWKFAAIHAEAGSSASDFYKNMALALAKALARETKTLVKVYLGTTEVTAKTDPTTLNGTYTSLIIKAVEQDWVRGTKGFTNVMFYAEPGTVTTPSGAEVPWGTVADSAGSSIGNGKEIADMEWFFMGERADQFRGMGFPNTIPTTYLVDPSKEYDVLTIHYSYVGANHAVQKSEKDIVIVGLTGDDNELGKVKAALDAILNPTEDAAEEETIGD